MLLGAALRQVRVRKHLDVCLRAPVPRNFSQGAASDADAQQG